MDPQEMCFERQVGEQCGVHAINNAVGGQVLLAGDMLGVAAEIADRHNAYEEFRFSCCSFCWCDVILLVCETRPGSDGPCAQGRSTIMSTPTVIFQINC